MAIENRRPFARRCTVTGHGFNDVAAMDKHASWTRLNVALVPVASADMRFGLLPGRRRPIERFQDRADRRDSDAFEKAIVFDVSGKIRISS